MNPKSGQDDAKGGGEELADDTLDDVSGGAGGVDIGGHELTHGIAGHELTRGIKPFKK
jgi:hypothetical protein